MTDEHTIPTPPRVFVSYSWSSPTHESWVLSLASRLRGDGVDIILDKWDLKPGHDAYVFMESMVTDVNVTKVLMICDKIYAEKANIRSGGVGTESQIISPQLYKSSVQDKFAALMTDEDHEGNAHTPMFYQGRIYFDFRSADRFEESYEQLLRWLVDRPLHVKPKLGSIPASILQKVPAAAVTHSAALRAESAIRQDVSEAAALVRDYCEALIHELKSLTPIETPGDTYSDTILTSVDMMRPYLRQFAGLVRAAVRFSKNALVWERILTVHEQLGTLMYREPEVTRWDTHQFDAYKIIAHDAFLNTVALALDEERFDLVETALNRRYLVREHRGADKPSTSDFWVFRQYVESLEHRNRSLKLNRLSLQADLLKEARPVGSVPSFESLMQADFILYIRACGMNANHCWYPLSLVYTQDRYTPFPLFARAESRAYLVRLLPLIGASTIEEMQQRLAAIDSSEQVSRIFDYRGLPVANLSNMRHLGTLN